MWKKELFKSSSLLCFFSVLCSEAFGGNAASTHPQSAIELANSIQFHVDKLWILIAAAMVFFMQTGFLALEIGVVQDKNTIATGQKNVIDFIVSLFAFLICGFGLMFGFSNNGFFGHDFFFLNGIDTVGHEFPWTFFLFQTGFLATAVTIVSGAMCERTNLMSYALLSFFIGMIIYPLNGFLVWGNAFVESNTPFLANLGFLDFAGSTVVHSVGGWIALIALIYLGPRIGRFDSDGNPVPLKQHNPAFFLLGTLILWFGWWGFNGGSVFALNKEVGLIILNTNISGAAGGIMAFLHCWFFEKREGLFAKLAGGCLGGLVAITACCNVVSPVGAATIGAIAGILHNYGSALLFKLKLDDPVGAVPVHLICGVWGTLCVGIFGKVEFFGEHTRIEQIGIQLVGIITCAIGTSIMAFVCMKFLRHFIGLRVSPQEEMKGIHNTPVVQKNIMLDPESIEKLKKLIQ